MSGANLRATLLQARALLAPPPKLTVSQWADTYRYLSPEATSVHGRWRTARAPYQREVMDAVSDPQVEDIVCMWSAQVGKTEMELNVVGYFIHQDPAPMLFTLPTLQLATATSKDRLTPMLRDSPCFRGKVKESRARDGGNTLLHKTFPGGHITLGGANSPSSLSGRPVRVFLGDELSRWPKSAGADGSPKVLGFKRTATFWNRKRILVSTPIIKGDDATEDAFLASDQRHYYVPCPHCQGMQVLWWKDPEGTTRVLWAKHPDTGRHLPNTAAYLCNQPGCGALIDLDAHKVWMLARGEWRKHNPASRSAGFHLNELYSPWRRLRETVTDYLSAKREGLDSLKAWINTSLGLPWDPQDHQELPAEGFLAQRESWTAQVPWGVRPTGAAHPRLGPPDRMLGDPPGEAPGQPRLRRGVGAGGPAPPLRLPPRLGKANVCRSLRR